MLADVVKRSPNKIAVIFQNYEHTYGEIWNLLKSYEALFKHEGITCGDRICVEIKRSVDMIALLFAAIKTRCTFFIQNINHPPEKKKYYLEQFSPTHIITNPFDQKLRFQRNSHQSDRSLDNIAYVIFTSGSTGHPKGVMISYDALNHTAKHLVQSIGLRPYDRLGAISSVSFDPFIMETIFALCNGLTVVLANENECENPRAIQRLCVDHKITALQMVPSKLRMIQHADPALTSLSKVEKLYVGGERISKNLVDIIHQNKSTVVFNLYGLTEDSIWTSMSKITNSDVIDIGEPITGHEIILFDDNMKPIGRGQEGMIYLSGKGIMKGFINQESLFLNVRHRQYLCTGDYARKTHDGKIVLIGRKDTQMKIQGHRVEPEEIEKAAYAVDGIQDAVAKKFTSNADDDILCLFYTCNQPVELSEIQCSMKDYLPEALHPQYYFQIDSFTYLPSGKIDRNALELNTIYQQRNNKSMNIPDSFIIKAIELIAEVTNHKVFEISLASTFDSLGTTSILFVKLIISCEKKFNVEFAEGMMISFLFENVGNFISYIYSLSTKNSDVENK